MPTDGTKTKEMIIKTAIQLFKENGYNSVTVQDICHSTNIKRATFYYHFKTKDAILDSLYDSIVIPDTYSSRIVTTINCWLKLWLIIKPTVDWMLSIGHEILSIIFITNLQSDRKAFFPLHEDLTKYTLIDIIEKGQEDGQFSNTKNPLDIYHNLRNIIFGTAFSWCIKYGSFDEEKETHDSLASLLQVESKLVTEEISWLASHTKA